MTRRNARTSESRDGTTGFPLLSTLLRNPDRSIAWSGGKIVTAREFANSVATIANNLPDVVLPGVVSPSEVSRDASSSASMLNLCENRLNFMLAFGAALLAKHTTLLPASRATQVVADAANAFADCYRFGDEQVQRALSDATALPTLTENLRDTQIAMVSFTSGSTGHSKGYAKSWGYMASNTQRTAGSVRAALSLPLEGQTPWLVATVPPQHMYGMELSVLLPLLAEVAVHSGRPLFPADIAAALAVVPEPRILVSTPVHLRALIESSVSLPSVAGVISATAPLDRELALKIEQRFATALFEVFGSTETCAFATRRTARGETWHLYPDVELTPQFEGTSISAPWFCEPVVLQDIVETLPNRRFIVRGRNSDLIDVAGKRASLIDLTRRLLAVEGVRDAVVFPPDPSSPGRVRRVAALAVAPGIDARTVLNRLSASVDPAFLPRPLILVDALPRNETGKLPREQLLAVLRRSRNS